MKIKQKLMVLMCISALLCSACRNASSDKTDSQEGVVQSQVQGTVQVSSIDELTGDRFDSADLYNDFDKSKSAVVTLSDAEITVDSLGKDSVGIEGHTVTLKKGGNYYFTGSVSDGKIVIDSANEENVRIILDNASITNTTGSVIYIKQAQKTIVTVADGSNNAIVDAGDYSKEEEGVTAAVFANGDLTFNGNGQLSITGNYADAIATNADFKISSGVLNIQSKDDGIVASKGVSVKNGSFNLQCGGNGMKTTSTLEAEGFIGIESGSYTIIAGADVCKATGSIYYVNGGFTGTSGGGSSLSSTEDGWGKFGDETTTAKGFKAGGDIRVYGGSLNFDTADDIFYAENAIAVENGCVIASSGDDGFVSGKSIEIKGGSITLQKTCQGLESNEMNLSGGYLDITAKGDGFNIANGTDSYAANDRPGKNEFTRNGQGSLVIKDTCINVRSDREAMNVAGDLTISGGAVRVRGANDTSLKSIDCSGTYAIEDGQVLAAGNEEKFLVPAKAVQPVVILKYKEKQEGKSVICIKDSKDKVIVAFCIASEYDKVVLSMPALEKGKEYTWCKASLNSDLEQKFGDVQPESYTAGEKIASFTVQEGTTEVSE
ncbi:carbohydrate-binding domain-containing protein [[Clostridium] polysaccharolyticum]|uniref:Carbohydrate-binding domain-containing protein n=1 Tax=[Clostridium] polysaccharolyticum TaxID=29364 RepID=A0A1I0FKL8_9FIRM|nr:carbohydrate-binding domain-containing protein [[Clostridium] polysaccharolyticum]SET58745.1 protein of unknown function [[Clostridium] polysaccharolyticum]